MTDTANHVFTTADWEAPSDAVQGTGARTLTFFLGVGRNGQFAIARNTKPSGSLVGTTLAAVRNGNREEPDTYTLSDGEKLWAKAAPAAVLVIDRG